MLLYLAADLIWGTKIKATAQAVGVIARPVRSLEMLEARLSDQTPDDPVRAVVLDLEKPDEALAMLTRLRGSNGLPSIRVLCWAPHVERALMEDARNAGADAVMTRGAFDAQMEKVLRELDGK